MYDFSGFSEVTPAFDLFTRVSKIIESGNGRAIVSDFVDGLGRGARQLDSITYETILTNTGRKNEDTKEGTTLQRHVAYLVNYVLWHAGIVPKKPAALMYRHSPALSLDEMAWRVVSANMVLPGNEILKPTARLDELAEVVMSVVRTVSTYQYLA